MTARRRTSASPLMAGWLSANLLLGLMIIMLGTQAPLPSPASPASPAEAVADTTRLRPDTVRSLTETTRPPAEKPQTEKPPAEESSRKERKKTEKSPAEESPARFRLLPSPCTDLVGGVRAEPTTLSFRVAPGTGDGVLAAQVRQELRGHGGRLAGRRAGMVLTFGTGDGAGEGVRLATRVNAAIREAYPRVFGTAVTRNFHDLAAPNGSISMEIYFVTHGCSPAPTDSRSTR
ncbi:hypothetical protein ACSDR0_01940 [Streptosporangium sp. G11]|uniref:hypothetical protein n=1 Tax=Streptosporangium sp. G11 TaxID=3436926 RepID=UPI003EBA9A33